jgi:excisionase family DNA binding protein
VTRAQNLSLLPDPHEANNMQDEPNNEQHFAEVAPYGLPAVLTVEETARFLRLNVKTVHSSISKQEIPARKIGKRTVVLRDALLNWLRCQERVLPRRSK